MGLQQFDEHAPWIDFEPMDDSWGATPQLFIGTNNVQVRVDSMILTSDDTVDRVVAFWVGSISSPQCLLGSILVPAGAGTDGVIPAVEAMPTLSTLNRCLIGTAAGCIYVAPVTGPSAGKVIYLTSIGGLL